MPCPVPDPPAQEGRNVRLRVEEAVTRGGQAVAEAAAPIVAIATPSGTALTEGPSSANTEGPPRLWFSLTETLGGLAQHDGSAASERGTPVARLADLGAARGLDAEEAERPAREPTQADHGGARRHSRSAS